MQAFHLRLQTFRLTRLLKFHQLLNDIPDLLNDQVRGHVAVDLVDVLQRTQLVLHTLEHALGGGHQRGSLAVARLH